MKELSAAGKKATRKLAEVITKEEEAMMWENRILESSCLLRQGIHGYI